MQVRAISLGADVYGGVTIRPFGDVQVGSRACDEQKAREFIKEGIAEGAYFIGMGDYVDFANPSDRKRLQAALLNDTSGSTIVDAAYKAADDFLDVVSGTAGRWLGLLEGHHFFPLEEGETSDTYIAASLHTPFLGTTAMLILKLPWGDEIQLWAHHGAGSGGGIAAPLAKLETVAADFDADIYLMGHYHRRVVASTDRLTLSVEGGLRAEKRWLVCTGSYLRSYQENVIGTYVEKGLLRPVSLGGVTLRLEQKGLCDTRIGVEMWEY